MSTLAVFTVLMSSLASAEQAERAVVISPHDAPAGVLEAAATIALTEGGGTTVRDASGVFNALWSSELSASDVRSPPPQWPQGLDKQWREAHAACGERPIPAEAKRCIQQVRSALWNRWLVHSNVSDVIEVELQESSGEKGWTVSARWYARSAEVAATARKSRVAPADLARVVGELAKVALQGGQVRTLRSATTFLPGEDADSGASLNEFPVDLGLNGVPVPPHCQKKLPARLEVSPGDSSLAKTLLARWKKSAGAARTGGVMKCRLIGGEGMFGLTGLKTLQVTLECGRYSHRAEVSTRTLRERSWGVLTERLIKSIFADACRVK